MGAEEIPSEAIEALRAILDARLGPEVADQARLDFSVEANEMTVTERRAPYFGGGEWSAMPLARLRLEQDASWTLLTTDDEGRWEDCLWLDGHQLLEVLLEELDEDPTGFFWG